MRVCVCVCVCVCLCVSVCVSVVLFEILVTFSIHDIHQTLSVFHSLLFWTDVEDRNPRIERMHVRDMRRDVFLRLRQRPRPMALSIDFKDDMYVTSVFRGDSSLCCCVVTSLER